MERQQVQRKRKKAGSAGAKEDCKSSTYGEARSHERVKAVCRDYGLEPRQAIDIEKWYDFDFAVDARKHGTP